MFTTVRGLRLRRSFRKLEKEHYEAIKKREDDHDTGPYVVSQLEKLVLAFKHIQSLPPDNQNSFFVIGGYHGAPYRGAGWSNANWWGGYCSHGQITFPTWHRAYLQRLENALRTAPGCADVTLPFLDWCDEETKTSGLPGTLTSEEFLLGDGNTRIPNSLFSYTLPRGLFSPLNDPNTPHADYTKLAGYKTMRYPYRGLVGNDEDLQQSKEYNEKITAIQGVTALNDNVKNWLHYSFQRNGKPVAPNTYQKFRKCLDAPNYTLFSNTSSAGQYNQEQLNRARVPSTSPDIVVVPLESPHNDMHLCVGGFNIEKAFDANPDEYAQANGDMGENDTAALDPIFHLHHCFIDRMFWLWQLKHNEINELVIGPEYENYPGTNNVDSQGASAGQAAGEWITLKSPLQPFKKNDGTVMTSLDVVNIENQLGYTYDSGSFTDDSALPSLMETPGLEGQPEPVRAKGALTVSGTNRGAIPGSYTIEVTHKLDDGKIVLLGVESVLSRWHTAGCANCQTHLAVTATIPLPGFDDANTAMSALNDDKIKVNVRTRAVPKDGVFESVPPPKTVATVHFPKPLAPGVLVE